MDKTKSNIVLIGWLSGFIYFLFVFRWLWDAYPLSALGISSHVAAFFLILTAYLLTVFVSSVFWTFAMGIFVKVEKKISWASLIVFPSFFVWFEYLRTLAISILWSGPGNGISSHWTAGNLAYLFSGNSLALKFSSWFGIYGVLFLIIFIAVLFFLLFEKKYFKKLMVLLAIVVVLSYLPYDRITAARGEIVKTAIIQTEIPSRQNYTSQEQLSFFKKQLELLNELNKSIPDVKLVVFPEGSNFFKNLSLFGNTFSVSRYFYNLFPSSVVIADNSRIQEDSSLKSKTILLDSKKGIVGSYDKRLLTPNGEYVPHIFRLILKALGIGSDFLEQVQEFKKGDRVPSAISFGENNFSAGVLVCSDIFSPEFSRNISLSGGNLFVAQASFGFVNGSKSLISQTKAAARFRAAENNKPLVYASNYGTSFIISGSGKILKESKNPGFEILTGDIVLNSNKTLYNKIGDWPILLASLSVLAASFFWREKENV